VTVTGGAKCWGHKSFGQGGDSSNTQRLFPIDVSGLTSGGAQNATGYYHSCAGTNAGGAKSWGFNSSNQLGDGTNSNRNMPVDVSGLTSGVAKIVAGSAHTCALLTGGGVKCWGQNSSGQLGDSSNTQRPTPVDVTGLTSGVID